MSQIIAIDNKIKAAKESRENLIAQINATNGYIQALEEMRALLLSQEIPAAMPTLEHQKG